MNYAKTLTMTEEFARELERMTPIARDLALKQFELDRYNEELAQELSTRKGASYDFEVAVEQGTGAFGDLVEDGEAEPR